METTQPSPTSPTLSITEQFHLLPPVVRDSIVLGGLGLLISLLTFSNPVTGGLYVAFSYGCKELLIPGMEKALHEYIPTAEKSHAVFLAHLLSSFICSLAFSVGFLRAALLTLASIPLRYAINSLIQWLLPPPPITPAAPVPASAVS